MEVISMNRKFRCCASNGGYNSRYPPYSHNFIIWPLLMSGGYCFAADLEKWGSTQCEVLHQYTQSCEQRAVPVKTALACRMAATRFAGLRTMIIPSFPIRKGFATALFCKRICCMNKLSYKAGSFPVDDSHNAEEGNEDRCRIQPHQSSTR